MTTLGDSNIYAEQPRPVGGEQLTPHFDEVPPVHEQRSGKGKLLAAGLGLTVLVGGGFGLTLIGDKEPRASITVEDEPSIEPEVQETPAPIMETSPTIDSKTALGIAVVNEQESIIATRPDGTKIRVPKLQDGSPSELADTFLTLFACYMTTESQDCLDEIAHTPGARELFILARRDSGIEAIQENPYQTDAQVEIFGTPRFFSGKTDTGASYIDLNPRTDLFLKIQYSDKDGAGEWQNHRYQTGEGYRLSKLRIEYQKDPNGNIKITYFGWDPTLVADLQNT